MTSIFVSSFRFNLLYRLHKDGRVSGRNMQEVIVYKYYFTSVNFVGNTVTLYTNVS